MRMPTATVITIFLDRRRFLGEAVESVLAQTFSDWELLLVDDGSRDGSTDVALGYAAREPERIRYLSHPGRRNRGMSTSRNLGLEHARGRYVAFLDSDDVLLPEALSEEVALLDAHPEAAMASGRALYWHTWDAQSAAGTEDHYDRPANGGASSVVPPPSLLRSYLVEGRAPCICSILVRRAALTEVGGFEARFRGLYEDQVVLAKLALRYPIVESDACWSRYRQHDDGACLQADARGQRAAARRRFLRWLKSYVETHGPADPAVAECVAGAIVALDGSGPRRAARILRAAAESGGASATRLVRNVASAARERLAGPLVKGSHRGREASGLRVAFLMHSFPEWSETFLLRQVVGLLERGHDVAIFCRERAESSVFHPAVERHRLLDRVYYVDAPRDERARRWRRAGRLLGDLVRRPGLARRF